MPKGTGNPEENVLVEFTVDTSHLDPDDQTALGCLVEAVDLINPVFFEQLGQETYEEGALFDPSRPTRFYPEDLTQTEFEAYLAQNPKEAEELRSHFTLVRRDGYRLVAIPYELAYRDQLERIALLLEEASVYATHEDFAQFLRARAGSFRTNDFSATDRQWVQTTGMPIELIIGPFEEYSDTLHGVKREFKGILGVVAEDVQARVQQYQELVQEFDLSLGSRYGYIPKTSLSPVTVIDQVAGGGGALFRFVPMASNLPNDQDIQREVGSKKTLVRNIMRAKFELLTTAIAERILEPSALSVLDPELQLYFVIGHELSHGLGFHFEGKDFLDLYGPFEEAKADVFGQLFLFALADNGVIDRDVATNAAIFHVADGVRQVRFGLEDAHAVGGVMQYQWFLEHGVLQFDEKGIRLTPGRFEEALQSLGDAFYHVAETRDHAVAEDFVSEWGQVPAGLREVIGLLEGIPIDIDPVFVN